MVTQKFKYSDSIDDAVKLLKNILNKKEEQREEAGEGKRTKLVKGLEVVTYTPPEIPLELPSGYFSKLSLDQLNETKENWQLMREQDNKKLQAAVKKQDKLFDAIGKVGSDPDKIGNVIGEVNHRNTRLQQVDFLLGELDKAILVLEPAPIDVFVLGTPIKESMKLLNAPPRKLKLPSRYFSGFDLEELKKTRDEWQQEIDRKHKKLQGENLKLKKMKEKGKSKKGDERSLAEKIKRLENELQMMDFLMNQLEKSIESGNRAVAKMKQKKGKGLAKDPILEEIKKKMDIPPQKKVPLPKISEKKMTYKTRPATQTMFDNRQTSEIGELFKNSRHTRGLEIEASFGVFKDDGKGEYFSPGVYSGIYFSNLLTRLFTVISAQNRGQMDIKYSNTLVEIKKSDFQQGGNYDKSLNVRKIIDLSDGSHEWQHKVKHEKIDNRIWGVRISKSVETFLIEGEKTGGKTPTTLGDVGIDPKTWKPSISRYRRRTSFTEASANGFFYGVRIDLTVIRRIDHDKNFNPRGFPGFEVEVEKINDINISADKFTEIIKQLYRWILGDYSYSVFIREAVKSPEGKALMIQNIPVNWNTKIKLFSDGTFAYMTEKDKKQNRNVQKAYGRIVPKHIRLLSLEDRQTLEALGKSKNVKNVNKESTMKTIQEVGIKRHSNLPDGRTWDKNLQIVTDGIYAYSAEPENKIYAIIVGPSQLSESDKEELTQMGKNIKDANQAEVNKITRNIQDEMEGVVSIKEFEELEEGDVDVDTKELKIYQMKPSGLQPVYHEEEITWYPDHIMTLEERKTAVNLHNRLFWRDMQKKRVCLNGEMQGGDRGRELKPYQLWSDYWNRPKNIKLKNLLDPKSRWALTLKYDGMRSFLFIHEYGTYMVIPPYTLIYMGEGDKDMSGTLLDGEFMSDLDKTTNNYTRITFWAFDILFVRDGDCRDKRLTERLSILNNSVQILQENPRNFPFLERKKYIIKDSPIFAERHLEKDTSLYENIYNLLKKDKTLLGKIGSLLRENKIQEETIEVLLKSVEVLFRDKISIKDIKHLLKEIQMSREEIKTFLKKIENFLKENKEIVEKTDGLILQPYIWYCNKYTFKWKPPSQLTIDFYLQRLTPQNIADRKIEYHDDMYYYYTMVGNTDRNKKSDMKIFTGDYNHPYIGYIMLEENTIKEGGEPIDGRIVECEWRKYEDDESDFVPFRIREDRTRPNDSNTATSVWQDINNPITQNTMEGRNLKIMRKYHNEVKMDLLAKHFGPGSTILDIGSGRGGDIHKWRTLGLKRVYAMEPDTGDSIIELRKRLEQDKKNKENEDIGKGIPFTYPVVEILNYGSEKTRKIQKQLKKDGAVLDGIVAFFSLTFFPKSEKLYKSLLNTIDLLPPGGKFVGIVLSGKKVKTLLNTSKSVYIKDYIDEKFLVKGYDSENDELGNWGNWNDAIEAWVFDDADKPEVKKWMETHKAYNCEAFTIKQKGPFFDQKDEDEEEVDKISNSIIGDEIMIDLRGTGDDQTTMVQSQTEWLFNFNYFKKKLKEKMFFITEEHLLINPVSSPKGDSFAYQNLPKDSQVFSSLNKVFVFTKKGLTKEEVKAAEVLNTLESGVTASIRLKLNKIEYDDIQRVGVIQSNTSFIHAVLLATNRKYQKMNNDERESQVSVVRGKLANELTHSKFQELHGGSIAKNLEGKIQIDIDKKRLKLNGKTIKEKAFEVFKKTLGDTPSESKGSGSWLGELEMTELLSRRYNVNIYVVSVTGTIGDMVLLKPSTLFSNYCDSLYVYNKSVVILRQHGIVFDLLKPLGDKEKTNTFDANSEFAQQLHREICG